MARRKTPRRVRGLHALTPDPQNANLGTARGRRALGQSLRELGAGRSILIHQHGVVMPGNKTVEEAKTLGIPVKVVRSDGTQLIAVQRTDLETFSVIRARRRSPWPITGWRSSMLLGITQKD